MSSEIHANVVQITTLIVVDCRISFASITTLEFVGMCTFFYISRLFVVTGKCLDLMKFYLTKGDVVLMRYIMQMLVKHLC